MGPTAKTMKAGALKYHKPGKLKYRLTQRGRELVEALPDRAKVNALKAKWAREDRMAK